MSLRACVKVFAAKGTGAGVQTITGIADGAGAFTPKFILFFCNASSTLASNEGWWVGFDSVATHKSIGNVCDVIGTISGVYKGCTSFISGGLYSVIRNEGNIFANDATHKLREAYVSAFRSGEFDLTYDKNIVTGDSIMAVVFGGDDLSWSLQQGSGGFTGYTFGFPAQAVIMQPLGFGSTGDPLGQTGARPYSLGWGTRDGDMNVVTEYIAADTSPSTSASNGRYQSDDFIWTVLDGSFNPTIQRTISSWNSTGIVLSGTLTTTEFLLGIGGTEVLAKAGTFTEPSVAGLKEVTTGLSNKIVIITSTGQVAGASSAQPLAQLSIGVMTDTGQGCYWFAEECLNLPLQGSRMLSSTDTVLITNNADTTGTVFTSRAQKSVLATVGKFILNFSAVSGSNLQYNYLALGPLANDAVITDVAVNCSASPRTLSITGINFDTDVIVTLTRNGSPVTFTLTRNSSTSLTLSNLSPAFASGSYCATAVNP